MPRLEYGLDTEIGDYLKRRYLKNFKVFLVRKGPNPMVTRRDIDDERVMIERLLKLANPTGALHSATPWAAAGDHDITAAGAVIAQFRHREDRDVALYFTNAHAGMIMLLRSAANAWEFLERGVDDAGLINYAKEQAEMLRGYADIFCRLGRIEADSE